ILLLATVAFGQNNGARTPADMYGPVRSDDTRARTPTVDLDHSYFYHEPFKINQKLESKLKTLLPQSVTPKAAAKGFLELQDFVATVRAANNLSVAFLDLKHTMLDGSSKAL